MVCCDRGARGICGACEGLWWRRWPAGAGQGGRCQQACPACRPPVRFVSQPTTVQKSVSARSRARTTRQECGLSREMGPGPQPRRFLRPRGENTDFPCLADFPVPPLPHPPECAGPGEGRSVGGGGHRCGGWAGPGSAPEVGSPLPEQGAACRTVLASTLRSSLLTTRSLEPLEPRASSGPMRVCGVG